jgi:hypothetical protein
MLLMMINMGIFGIAQGCRHLSPSVPEKRAQERAEGENSSAPEKEPIEKRHAFPENPSTLPIPKVSDPFLLKLLQPESMRLPASERREWPHTSWSRAKSYAFNFVSNHPGYREKEREYHASPWMEEAFQADIVQEKWLTKEQAETALELIHRTAGGQIMTKCPIFVRHAVVFFNAQEEAVGWISICFECSDSMSYPQYFPEEQEAPFLFGLYQSSGTTGEWDFGTIYDEVYNKWELLFDGLGMAQYLVEE